MNQGRIIVITGAPGTGKTTTASVVAKESDLEKSVHMLIFIVADIWNCYNMDMEKQAN